MTRRGAVLRVIALAAVIGIAILIAVFVGIPSAAQLRSTFGGLGAWAPFLFAALYAVATLSPLPKSVFTLAAGVVFGLAEGLLVVVCGSVAGAVLAFYVARMIGRDGVQRLIGERASHIDELFVRRAFLGVLVARLIPIVPFTVVNYLAGLTAIRLPIFVAATAIGILPATTAYIAIGAYGSDPGSWPFWVAVGSLVALTVVGVIAQAIRRRRSRPDVSAKPSDDGSTPTPS